MTEFYIYVFCSENSVHFNAAKTNLIGAIPQELCEGSTITPIIDCNNISCDCCDCSQTMSNKTAYAIYSFALGPDRLLSNEEVKLLEDTLVKYSSGIEEPDISVFNISIALDLINDNMLITRFDAECEINLDIQAIILSYFASNTETLLIEIKKVPGLGLESDSFFHYIDATWWFSFDDDRERFIMNAKSIPNRFPNMQEIHLLQRVMFNFTSSLNGDNLNMTNLMMDFVLESSRSLQIISTFTAQVAQNADFSSMLFSHISTNFSDMITKIKNTPGLGLELDSYFHSASFEIYVPATPELLSKPIENNISQSHLAAIAAAVSSLLSCNNINPSDIFIYLFCM